MYFLFSSSQDLGYSLTFWWTAQYDENDFDFHKFHSKEMNKEFVHLILIIYKFYLQ